MIKKMINHPKNGVVMVTWPI